MDKLQSRNNLDQVGMYLCDNSHDTFQQDDDPAVSFALHLHEYTRYSIELSAMDTHPAPFSKVELIRIVVGDIFLVLGGNLDKILHLIIRNNEIFQARTFLPHHELQEIIAFLKFRNLYAAGMYEYEIRNDRNEALRFHAVIDSYSITFRNKIFQSVSAFEFFLRSLFAFIGSGAEVRG